MLQLVSDLDPVEQLDEAKRVIQARIASQKTLLTAAKKAYRQFDNLKLEDHPDISH